MSAGRPLRAVSSKIDAERFSAARAAARARRPDGAPMGPFRWAAMEDGQAVWLFARVLPARPATLAVAARLGPDPGESEGAAFGYWLAHALRQDLWRALRGRRGVVPLVVVEGLGGEALWLTAGAATAEARTLPGRAPLAAVLEAPGLRRHLRWARGRAAGQS